MANTKLIELAVDNPLKPEDLRGLLEKVEKAVPASTPRLEVILSGRLPIWAYCALAHLYHAALWVATYDPRLDGAVVVMTHDPNVKTGDVVPVNDQVETVKIQV